MTSSLNPADLYAERRGRFVALGEELGRRSRLVSNLRGLAFGGAVVLGLVALFGTGGGAAGALAAASGVAFLGLVLWHARILRAEDDAWRWAKVNDDAVKRCTGRWRELPEGGARFADPDHPYAVDLDLFGHGSLFQRLNVAHTRYGQERLASFLSEPARVGMVEQRQEAARVLAVELDTRQRLEALALAVVEPPGVASPAGPSRRAAQREHTPDPEPLLRWAEGPLRLSGRRTLVLAAYVLPPITLGALLASALLALPAAVWGLPLFLQVLVAYSARDATAQVFNAVSSGEGGFSRYGPMLELLEGIDVPSSLLRDLREQTVAAGQRPSASMRRFGRLVGWFELRHNGLAHPFVNALLLWDIHCVLRLEAWQQSAGRHARRWFAALGELEAVSALAGLAHDEPGFAWPELQGGSAFFEAEALGHPLIEAGKRIDNDVRLPEAGRALLITGSNMSGKSTLLRSMGIAAVMAAAGAPVCASRLRLGELEVRTSLRISDSLEQGVSHFYAELKKLKNVLNAAEEGRPVLFLLDEILHGTNSRERQIGARWVLGELLRRGAVGAVSTHDMGLCQLPEALMHRVEQLHFRESVENGQMTFDFKLRPGPVRSGNALQLMRLVGLGVPLEGDEEEARA